MPKSVFSLNYLGKWIYFKPVKAEIQSAKLVFFHGEKYEERSAFDLSQAVELLEHNEFNNMKPTVFYIHGFLESLKSESVECVVNAYLKRGDHNIVVLDWSEISQGNYIFQVIPDSEKLGNLVATTLLDLFNTGMDSKKLHIIGHSLGAHIGGLIGRRIYEKSDRMFKLNRVTGLDPAFPPFYPAIFYKALNKNDANLVDVIHTDAFLYGAPVRTGTVDFWPNKGKSVQIGCPKRNYQLLTQVDLCSHQRSWRFWVESVENKNERSFQAVKCSSWKDFRLGKFDQNSVISMGIDCDMNAKGNYYLQTNGETPYSRGAQGIVYDPNRPHEKKEVTSTST